MESMVGDIVYALIAFNGDLISLTQGGHISGNSLTTVLNGICGSLNMRCHYYDVPRSVPFRDVVKLMTYGDDNVGSVSVDLDDFGIDTISAFLGKYGQTYTMPDKESLITRFLPVEDLEFLKRKSVYHQALGVSVGALAEGSCFKMLHCFLRSKKSPLSEEAASGINVDTALREWFNHGPEVFEMRRMQLKQVVAAADLTSFCNELEHTYDDRVIVWRHVYLGEPLPSEELSQAVSLELDRDIAHDIAQL